MYLKCLYPNKLTSQCSARETETLNIEYSVIRYSKSIEESLIDNDISTVNKA